MKKEARAAQQRYFAKLAERAHEAERILASISGSSGQLPWKQLSESHRERLTLAANNLYDNQATGGTSQMSRLCVLGETPEISAQQMPEMYKCGPELVNAVESLVGDIVSKKSLVEVIRNWDQARKGDWFEKI